MTNSQHHPKPLAAPAAPATSIRPRVLVVDDSRVIRRAIGKILNAEFDLIEAENGEAGWDTLLQDDTIEVVVSDVEMPKLDGHGLIRRIRESDVARIRSVPVIMITGAEDEASRQRAFACGASDFVTKPIDAVQLLARARAHAKFDQTTRKLSKTEKSLEEQSAADPLTQLSSRRYLIQRGTQDLAYAKRHGTELSVIRLAVDDFLSLAENYGEPVREQILIWLGKIFTATTRTEDTAAYLLNGEFAVIAPATGLMDTAVLCERLRAAVGAKPYPHLKEAIPISVSLGLATLDRDHGNNIEELLAYADARLARAKTAGGNRLVFSDADIKTTPTPPPTSPSTESAETVPDLETALKQIADGADGMLTSHLPTLVARVLPLIESWNRILNLGLGATIDSIRAKLAGKE